MARPSQIILLDEIDKAHPDVFNVLLQVFDAGRLTDGQGRTAKFGETLIIMTSNLGAALYQNPDLTFEQATTAMREQVRGSFKPEFINRIDEIIGFNRLDGKNIKKVIRKEFNTLGKLVKDRGVIIDIDDSCVDKIAANENEGGHYDPAFGGRGIVRYLKMNAKDKLALEILAMPKGAKTNTRLTATYDTAARGIKILRESLDQPANMPVSPAIPTPKAA
jgi:ATP-dependent Clp protease ATP-binding subunit ClpB